MARRKPSRNENQLIFSFDAPNELIDQSNNISKYNNELTQIAKGFSELFKPFHLNTYDINNAGLTLFDDGINGAVQSQQTFDLFVQEYKKHPVGYQEASSRILDQASKDPNSTKSMDIYLEMLNAVVAADQGFNHQINPAGIPTFRSSYGSMSRLHDLIPHVVTSKEELQYIQLMLTAITGFAQENLSRGKNLDREAKSIIERCKIDDQLMTELKMAQDDVSRMWAKYENHISLQMDLSATGQTPEQDDELFDDVAVPSLSTARQNVADLDSEHGAAPQTASTTIQSEAAEEEKFDDVILPLLSSGAVQPEVISQTQQVQPDDPIPADQVSLEKLINTIATLVADFYNKKQGDDNQKASFHLERATKLAMAISEKDVAFLIDAYGQEGKSLFGIEGSAHAFSKVTGQKLTGSAANRREQIYAFAGYSQEQKNDDIERLKQLKLLSEESARVKKLDVARNKAAEIELGIDKVTQFKLGFPRKMPGNEFIDELIKLGYTKVQFVKKTIQSGTYLVNPIEELQFKLPRLEVSEYALLATEDFALKQAVMYANDPLAADIAAAALAATADSDEPEFEDVEVPELLTTSADPDAGTTVSEFGAGIKFDDVVVPELPATPTPTAPDAGTPEAEFEAGAEFDGVVVPELPTTSPVVTSVPTSLPDVSAASEHSSRLSQLDNDIAHAGEDEGVLDVPENTKEASYQAANDEAVNETSADKVIPVELLSNTAHVYILDNDNAKNAQSSILEMLNKKAKKYDVPPVKILSSGTEAFRVIVTNEIGKGGEDVGFTRSIQPLGDKKPRAGDEIIQLAYADIEFEIIRRNGFTILGKLELDELNTPTFSSLGAPTESAKGNLLDYVGALIETTKEENVPCDHCEKDRNRKTAFIVETPEGDFQTVGSTCVEDYIGLDPKNLLNHAKFYEFIRFQNPEAAEFQDAISDKGGVAYDVEAVVIASFIAFARDGQYISSTKAQDLMTRSTRDHVSELLNKYSTDVLLESEEFTLQRDQAKRAIGYAKSLVPDNAYHLNLSNIAQSDIILESNHHAFATLVSLPTAYFRDEKQTVEHSNSVHVGRKDHKLETSVFINKVTDVDSDYGVRHVFAMNDNDGNVLRWTMSSGKDLHYAIIKAVKILLNVPTETKLKVDIAGKVKAHTEFNKIPNTILTRSSFSQIQNPHEVVKALFQYPVVTEAYGVIKDLLQENAFRDEDLKSLFDLAISEISSSTSSAKVSILHDLTQPHRADFKTVLDEVSEASFHNLERLESNEKIAVLVASQLRYSAGERKIIVYSPESGQVQSEPKDQTPIPAPRALTVNDTLATAFEM
ncbi:hypothetical protein R6242_19480 [Iodobacter sp. CM08]|uniref:hypothetical protein n=1 Tax=Iodobacter sp. CM08 TaxID=3085902 RepID=UPI0029812442|nr:hypothetical protein [Iodobacter sp. CM08]MDW5418754.1 hypothetical protein [Iodobacter sp. CM08]